jgi:hypothetical protein
MENVNQYSGLGTSARIQVGTKACFSLIKWDELHNAAFTSNPAFYYLQESDIDFDHHQRKAGKKQRTVVAA